MAKVIRLIYLTPSPNLFLRNISHFQNKFTNNAHIIKTLTSYFARRVFNDITPPRLCVAVVPEKHQLGFLAQFSV